MARPRYAGGKQCHSATKTNNFVSVTYYHIASLAVTRQVNAKIIYEVIIKKSGKFS